MRCRGGRRRIYPKRIRWNVLDTYRPFLRHGAYHPGFAADRGTLIELFQIQIVPAICIFFFSQFQAGGIRSSLSSMGPSRSSSDSDVTGSIPRNAWSILVEMSLGFNHDCALQEVVEAPSKSCQPGSR